METSEGFKCHVCSQPMPAFHRHYGGIVCFSCRSFFRRWTQIDPRPCKYSDQCDFPPKPGEKKCIKCRYEKCLQIGMEKRFVLNERQIKMRFRRTIRQREARVGQNSNSSPYRPNPNSPNHWPNRPDDGLNTPANRQNITNNRLNTPDSRSNTPENLASSPNNRPNTPNSWPNTPNSWPNTPNNERNTTDEVSMSQDLTLTGTTLTTRPLTDFVTCRTSRPSTPFRPSTVITLLPSGTATASRPSVICSTNITVKESIPTTSNISKGKNVERVAHSFGQVPKHYQWHAGKLRKSLQRQKRTSVIMLNVKSSCKNYESVGTPDCLESIEFDKEVMISVDFLLASPAESQNSGSLDTTVAFEPGHPQSSEDKEKNSDDIAVLDMIKNLDLRLIENVLMEEELHYLNAKSSTLWDKWTGFNIGHDMMKHYIRWAKGYGPLNPLFSIAGLKVYEKRLAAFLFEFDDTLELLERDYTTLLRWKMREGVSMFCAWVCSQTSPEESQMLAIALIILSGRMLMLQLENSV
ncbi:uncharacterized protein LOC111714597 [Eurytemora carolleeae]|uniref:uncharacterized protein LOC111714597 n=1 Tax=Eurytemora carolleeae TaxID=1294199 RepID=UPI000C770B43|nr:uncharacterized protein LOC111714597 [Eurytemora carolleeae]|eukprot:XP_023345507.1 uncharacterized protein LOC111714597 [Eurytemora affinis]